MDYSLLTLTPKQDDDKKKFWKFRVTEMWSSYKIWSFVVVVGFLATVIRVLTEHSWNNILDLANMGLATFVTLLVYLISRRWKKVFVYLMPLQMLVIFAGMLTKIYLLQEETTTAEWTVERHLAAQLELLAIEASFFAYVVIFCPSVVFLLCIYFPIYLGIHMT